MSDDNDPRQAIVDEANRRLKAHGGIGVSYAVGRPNVRTILLVDDTLPPGHPDADFACLQDWFVERNLEDAYMLAQTLIATRNRSYAIGLRDGARRTASAG